MSNESSLPAVLREHATLRPDETAYTFVDYQQDWAGVAESLTWSQLYRRSLNVAEELRSRGSTGDRVLISAPQGLDYVAGFLGALQAGMIAVPLSEPLGGAADERFNAVLRDASPAAILTTSSVVGLVNEHVGLSLGSPRRRSSSSTCWIWIRSRDRPSRSAARQASRICSTPPGRPVRRPE